MSAPDWSDAALADLARDYPADAHDDVADLIAGVRAVLRLVERSRDDYIPDVCCDHCWPPVVLRALNHPEETP